MNKRFDSKRVLSATLLKQTQLEFKLHTLTLKFIIGARQLVKLTNGENDKYKTYHLIQFFEIGLWTLATLANFHLFRVSPIVVPDNNHTF